MGELKLTVKEDKTRICRVPDGEFDLLGFTLGQMFSRTTGQARSALRPSKNSVQRVVEKVHELTLCARTWQETKELVGMLNRTFRGWATYFLVGTARKNNTNERTVLTQRLSEEPADILSFDFNFNHVDNQKVLASKKNPRA